MDARPDTLESFVHTMAYVHTEEEQRQNDKQTYGGFFVFIASLCAIMLIKLLESLFNINNDIQKHDWLSLIGIVFLFLLTLLTPLMLLLVFRIYQFLLRKAPTDNSAVDKSSLADRVLALRAQLQDERIVPIIVSQPVRLEVETVRHTPKRIGPLGRVIKLNLSFVYFFFVYMYSIQTMPSWFFANPFLTPLFVCLPGVMAILMFIFFGRHLRGNRVIVSEQSLRWKPISFFLINERSIEMNWSEITGFYETVGHDNKKKEAAFYIVDGPKHTFVWKICRESTQKEKDAHIYLIRLIATRTELPLRDLNYAIAPLLTAVVEKSQ